MSVIQRVLPLLRKTTALITTFITKRKLLQHVTFQERIFIKIMFLGFILHWRVRTIKLTTQSLSFIGSEGLW